jgi:hypothetical protein
MDPNIALAIVLVTGWIGVVYGWFTVRGSGISETPYGKVYGGAPGAFGPGRASGHDDLVSMRDWTRGTR